MKKIFFILSFILFMLSINCISSVSANETLVKNSKSAILIEEETGLVLFSKNEHTRLSPASMTKIMSLILVCEKIEKEEIKLDDIITISKNASSTTGSRAFLSYNELISVHELIKCVAVASANDAMIALAETICGSEAQFVVKMNEKASELQLENTHFTDCTGLGSNDHYSSSYDMSIMSKYLLNNYKEFILEYTNIYMDYIRQGTDREFWLVNTNKLIRTIDGLDGLKTGYTSEAGYCLTSTMVKNDMRLISVVMGYDSSSNRNSETVELLNYGFSSYSKQLILTKDMKIYSHFSLLYKPMNFNVILKEDIFVIKSKDSEKENVSWEIIEYPTQFSPGFINVYLDNEFFGKYEIIYDTPIVKRNFLEVVFVVLKYVI